MTSTTLTLTTCVLLLKVYHIFTPYVDSCAFLVKLEQRLFISISKRTQSKLEGRIILSVKELVDIRSNTTLHILAMVLYIYLHKEAKYNLITSQLK